jgi:antirestriction protein ArdC
MFGSSQYAYEELVAEMAACFMSVNLPVEPTQSHIDNHKAYVQSWIQAIRDKPESLVKAIKDAQTAASFMDWKGGFITEKEYLTHRNSTIIIPTKSARTLDMER